LLIANTCDGVTGKNPCVRVTAARPGRPEGGRSELETRLELFTAMGGKTAAPGYESLLPDFGAALNGGAKHPIYG
jgi:hypothetical protein